MHFFQLFVIAFFVLTGWLAVKQHRRGLSIELISPTWRRLAEANGWRFVDGRLGTSTRMEGTFEGYDFTAQEMIEAGRVLFTVVLRHPASDVPEVRIEDNALITDISSFAEDDFMAGLTEAVATARRVDGAGEEAWAVLAASHNLVLSSRRGERILRGMIDGHAVRIGTQAESAETIIRVRIGAPWPDGVLIQPRTPGAVSALSTGNPILDSLVTVTAPDSDAVRSVLCAPSTAEDLLAVLHPFPRSSVVGGHVQMHCPGRLNEDLVDRLGDALALADCLRGGPPAG